MPVRSLLLSSLFAVVLACPNPAGAAVHLASAPATRAEAVSGVAPALDPPSNMIVAAGSTAEQTLHATDADGDSLFFSKGFGPAYMTVVTTGSGGGLATGLIQLAPLLGDVGTTSASVVVTDGVFQDARTFSIQVTGA